MDNNTTKTINFSAADKAVVAYLETLGEKGATLAEINKACSLNLKPSNMTTLKHKGVITTKPEKLAVETPAKRKVSLYHFARSKDDALAIAKTDTERNLIIDGNSFGLRKDGVSFTLNDFNTTTKGNAKSGSFTGLVKKGILAKEDAPALVDGFAKKLVSVYVFVKRIED